MSFCNRYRVMLISIVLAVMTLAAYWRVMGCGFVRYDDNFYITANPHISAGLTGENIRWALTAVDAANWHPLTWLSYLVDVAISGTVDAEQFHLTNLLLHLANVLLLFLLLRRLTKSVWRSAFVAALFAVHPLHVESVAWIAERKDVLSTLFWLLTVWAYARYSDKPGAGRYAVVMVLFALGLTAKPMLVTLPILLLLLDYWPLTRLRTADDRRQTGDQRQRKGFGRLAWEKAPLFLLSAASCVITFYAQQHGKAVTAIEAIPLGMRLSNAVVAYLLYIWKMVWPARLAVLYPHPGASLPIWLILLSSAFLVGVSALVLRYGRKRPYLAVGWLWYVIMLIPVIGIVQVGEQAMADRYTYVPLIGIFVMIAWGVPECMGVWGYGRKGESERSTFKGQISSNPKSEIRNPRFPNALILVSACVIILVLGWLTRVQTGYWTDSIALFNHEIAVMGPSQTGYYNLAGALYEECRYAEAVVAYNKSIECKPDYMEGYYNLAVAALRAGDYAQAWKAVHAAADLGANVQPEFLDALSQKMPDPGR
jgi:protein O-mannosyl-transferase